MSVKPIDLQVHFSQINNVGKEQAVLKEGLLHQQAMMANESALESLNADKKVVKVAKESNPNKIQEKNQPSSKKNYSSFPRKNPYDDESFQLDEISHSENPFDDPDIGKILDLKG